MMLAVMLAHMFNNNFTCVGRDIWDLWSVYKYLLLFTGTGNMSHFSIPVYALSLLVFHSSPRTGDHFKKCGRKMSYGVLRGIWQCRWDHGSTASDLPVLLFQFRHSAASSGLAALLAKPQSNHINLLCAPSEASSV